MQNVFPVVWRSESRLLSLPNELIDNIGTNMSTVGIRAIMRAYQNQPDVKVLLLPALLAAIRREGYGSRLLWSTRNNLYFWTSSFVAQGDAVNQVDENNETPLHHAVYHGGTMSVRLLCQHGAIVNLLSDSDPIIIACRVGDLAIARILVFYGANIDIFDAFGMNSLQNATRFNQTAVVRWLVDSGADVNQQTVVAPHTSSLLLTIPWGNLASFRRLLIGGAWPDTTDGLGEAAIFHIISYEAEYARQDLLGLNFGWPLPARFCTAALVLLFQHGADMRILNNASTPPMHFAALSGAYQCVRALLFLGLKADDRCPHGHTVLQASIAGMNVGLVKMLLDSGADVGHLNGNGDSSFHTASKLRCGDLMTLLLAYGASIDQLSAQGQTALFEAAKQGDTMLVNFLLHHHAYVNAFIFNTESALHVAASNSFVDVVEILLAYGADTETQSIAGSTALVAAVKAKNREVVRMLIDHGADPNPAVLFGSAPVAIAVENQTSDILKILLLAGGDAHKLTNGEPPLQTAVSNKDAECVKLLLKAGADPLQPADDGINALELSVEMKETAITELLLKRMPPRPLFTEEAVSMATLVLVVCSLFVLLFAHYSITSPEGIIAQ